MKKNCKTCVFDIKYSPDRCYDCTDRRPDTKYKNWQPREMKFNMTVQDRILLEKALRVKSITNDEEKFLKWVYDEFYNFEYDAMITQDTRIKLKEITFIHDKANES